MSYIFLALLRLFNIATYIPVGSFKQTFIFVWYTPIPRATLQTLLSFLCSKRYTYTLVLLTNRNCLLRNLFYNWWCNFYSINLRLTNNQITTNHWYSFSELKSYVRASYNIFLANRCKSCIIPYSDYFFIRHYFLIYSD